MENMVKEVKNYLCSTQKLIRDEAKEVSTDSSFK